MNKAKHTLAVATCAFLWAFQAQGQTLTVNGSGSPGPQSGGSEITVEYSDPGSPGERILIEFENGSILNPLYDSIILELNENGEASETWTVPTNEEGWNSVDARGPYGEQVTFAVGPKEKDKKKKKKEKGCNEDFCE